MVTDIKAFNESQTYHLFLNARIPLRSASRSECLRLPECLVVFGMEMQELFLYLQGVQMARSANFNPRRRVKLALRARVEARGIIVSWREQEHFHLSLQTKR